MTSHFIRISAISFAPLLVLCGSVSAQKHRPVPAVGAPWVEHEKLYAENASSADEFGFSIAVSGNRLIVGALGTNRTGPRTGAAHIFEKQGNQWAEAQRLVPEPNGLSLNFGVAVDLDGDLAVVGAPGFGREGSAYVYRRVAGEWTQVARLQPRTPEGIVFLFGISVAVSGHRIVVGARDSRFNDPRNIFCQSGSVHVFEETSGQWLETALLLPDGLQCQDFFGWSVAAHGDTILVGAIGDGPADSGAAYLFQHTASGWRQIQSLLPTPEHPWANFGTSVALGSDTLVVGAPRDLTLRSGGSLRDTGSTYVFRRSVSGRWYQAQRLVPDDLMAGDLYGGDVALSGDSIAVGALLGDGVVPDSGTAYVYRRHGSTWTQDQKLAATDGESIDSFGVVAVQGSTTLVGAFDDDDLGPDAGAVYVFERRTASATPRNAGSNPASYTASRPLLGSSWTASVDLAGTTGHPFAALTGRLGPANTTLPGGQVLLVGGPRLFTLPMRPGPIATWTVPIPADPALAGLPVFTQAAHLSGERPFALSNAVDLVLGY